MQKIKITDPKAVDLAVRVLKKGGIVMHPTETCYGLAASIFNKKALEKLYKIKAMPTFKPVSILVSSSAMANKYGIFSDKAFGLAEKYWPGPLSLLVLRKKSVPVFFNKGNNFISVRFSSLSFCTEMVNVFGRPVTTTSANKSGEKELYLPKPVAGVDLLIDGGRISKNKPSTIVKVDGDRLEVIRQGDILCE